MFHFKKWFLFAGRLIAGFFDAVPFVVMAILALAIVGAFLGAWFALIWKLVS